MRRRIYKVMKINKQIQHVSRTYAGMPGLMHAAEQYTLCGMYIAIAERQSTNRGTKGHIVHSYGDPFVPRALVVVAPGRLPRCRRWLEATQTSNLRIAHSEVCVGLNPRSPLNPKVRQRSR